MRQTGMSEDLDLAVALSLQDVYEQPQKKHGVVDDAWELSDPTPNIHNLFMEFDSLFFWGKLAASGVAVSWSGRMTLCAGVCSYEGRGGLCSIKLSQPLLKLRPRRDLVETLLHEMIHAFLFVTKNNKDHDAHGPQFLSHMERINKLTGAKISVYHSFHREVKEYKQHWWKCDGPCQSASPYYGMVKRAMNRAPSPRDPWWLEHQKTCGGAFHKVKEPDGYGTKRRKMESGKKAKGAPSKGKGKTTGNGDIRELLKGQGSKSDPKQEATICVDSPVSVFKGRGFSVGGGETSSDSKRKMLEAAEKRRDESLRLRDLTVRRKRTSDGSRDKTRKKPRVETGQSDRECVIIAEPKPPSTRKDPPPSIIVLDDKDDGVKCDSPTNSASSTEEWLEDMEMKTCPVCEMANIPSAIINIHVSLCLEAEEQYRVIDDD